MGRRGNLEFSSAVKHKALQEANGRCEDCGSTENLHKHHRLGIQFFLAFFKRRLSPTIISSLDNLDVLCQKCHNKRGRKDAMEAEKIARKLERIQSPHLPGFETELRKANQRPRTTRARKRKPKQYPLPGFET